MKKVHNRINISRKEKIKKFETPIFDRHDQILTLLLQKKKKL